VVAISSGAAPAVNACSSQTFGYPGTYVLRLTGGDGELSSASEVSIEVAPQPGNAPTVVLT
jgi:hypothetical protein